MFGSTEKTKIDHFREIASYIVESNPNGLTVTQKKALAAIADKLEGDPIETLSGLVEKLTKKRAARKSTKPKKPPMDEKVLTAIIGSLRDIVMDRSAFESKVAELNKGHSAPEMKKIAASFAAGARPKTKADAVRILNAERNDQERAKQKAEEAGTSRPW